jgi:hypothetical protein
MASPFVTIKHATFTTCSQARLGAAVGVGRNCRHRPNPTPRRPTLLAALSPPPTLLALHNLADCFGGKQAPRMPDGLQRRPQPLPTVTAPWPKLAEGGAPSSPPRLSKTSGSCGVGEGGRGHCGHTLHAVVPTPDGGGLGAHLAAAGVHVNSARPNSPVSAVISRERTEGLMVGGVQQLRHAAAHHVDPPESYFCPLVHPRPCLQ